MAMSIPELNIINEYIKIPKMFFSTETEKLFSHCISCNNYLLLPGSQYVVEKVIRQYIEYNTTDTIFEYAMCVNCYQQVNESLSLTSKQNIEKYFNEHVDIGQRRHNLLKDKNLNIEDWVSHCIIKGTPLNELNEYQIACQCDGEYLLFTYMPILIGHEAMDEMMQLLSNKTIGEINGFYDKFCGLPPDLRKILNEPALFIL